MENRFKIPYKYSGLDEDRLYTIEDLCEMIEDLTGQYKLLEEEFEIYKQDVRDNYKRIPVSEQVGISDCDFI